MNYFILTLIILSATTAGTCLGILLANWVINAKLGKIQAEARKRADDLADQVLKELNKLKIEQRPQGDGPNMH